MSFKDKKNSSRKVLTSHQSLALLSGDKLIYSNSKVEADLIKFRIVNNKIKMMICIKSPVFYYDKDTTEIFYIIKISCKF